MTVLKSELVALKPESEQILFQEQLNRRLIMCFCFTEIFLRPLMVENQVQYR